MFGCCEVLSNLKSEGPDKGVVYVRLGSTNRLADRELVAELRRSAEGISFDELPMPGLSVDDLDLAAARNLFGKERALGENELQTLKHLTRIRGETCLAKERLSFSAKSENAISRLQKYRLTDKGRRLLSE